MVNTRLFLSTDVHGAEVTFRKFMNAGKVYKADIMIMAGDLTGKMLVPLVKNTDGSHTATYMGQQRIANNTEELNALQERIRFLGYYYFETDQEELHRYQSGELDIGAKFREQVADVLSRWVGMIEKHLLGTGIRCFMMPGNDDDPIVDGIIAKSNYVVNPANEILRLDDHHEMISIPNSNITPWKCPRDIPEDELQELIESQASKVTDMKNCVFNIHVPPYGTGIDVAPVLDAELHPQAGQMVPVGSKAVLEAMKKYQPLLGLHGHIHESRGAAKVGRTLCINPGSEYAEGVLHGAIVNLSEKGLKSYNLTQG